MLAYHGFFRSTATILRHPHGAWEVVFMGFRAGLGVGAFLLALLAHAVCGPPSFYYTLYGTRLFAWLGMAALLQREVRRDLPRGWSVLVCGLATNAALDLALLAAVPTLRQIVP
jgi:hypothetical protein